MSVLEYSRQILPCIIQAKYLGIEGFNISFVEPVVPLMSKDSILVADWDD